MLSKNCIKLGGKEGGWTKRYKVGCLWIGGLNLHTLQYAITVSCGFQKHPVQNDVEQVKWNNGTLSNTSFDYEALSGEMNLSICKKSKKNKLFKTNHFEQSQVHGV